MELKCAFCGVKACSSEPGTKKYPKFCAMSQENEALDAARKEYQDPEIQRFALAAAQTEADRYPNETRLEEIMSFARRMGYKHLGIANCAGLLKESRMLTDILEANGFKVSSVCCKTGVIPKEEIGIKDEEKITPGQWETLCNPIGQAKLLNEVGTDLNLLVGLCVGHDSLFIKYSEAPITVFIAKDRVTGHNPAAALYTSHSYYRSRLHPED